MKIVLSSALCLRMAYNNAPSTIKQVVAGELDQRKKIWLHLNIQVEEVDGIIEVNSYEPGESSKVTKSLIGQDLAMVVLKKPFLHTKYVAPIKNLDMASETPEGKLKQLDRRGTGAATTFVT